MLRWVPEFSVALAEALIYGVTIEQAAGNRTRERAKLGGSIPELADLIRAALVADLEEAATACIERLQAAAIRASDVTELMRAVVPLVRVALNSFNARDLAGAESLVELDELIDRANRRFVERLVDVMAEPSVREWGLRMVVVARTIERIGDRAVDIGEQTAYLLTAEFREFTDASHPATQS